MFWYKDTTYTIGSFTHGSEFVSTFKAVPKTSGNETIETKEKL